MQIITNEKLIRRNSMIARVVTIVGAIALTFGMYWFFKFPEQFNVFMISVVVGFILVQIGAIFTNRWARLPRSDKLLNKALKGLDNRFAILHFSTPASHLLVGPAGIWILFPRFQTGTITYKKGKWHQRGGGFFTQYMKIFGQEGLGRPDLEILNEIDMIQKYFKKEMPETSIPEIKAALIFTNEKTVIDIKDDTGAPAVTLHISKLKDFIRKTAKTKPISLDKVDEIQKLLLKDETLEKSSDDEHDTKKD